MVGNIIVGAAYNKRVLNIKKKQRKVEEINKIKEAREERNPVEEEVKLDLKPSQLSERKK